MGAQLDEGPEHAVLKVRAENTEATGVGTGNHGPYR